MKWEWHSYAPDGREVVVQRRGESWFVWCGASEAHSDNLDVALTRAIRAEAEVLAHAPKVDYPSWIRNVADAVDPQG
jgi:hypothetical protein